MQSPDGHAKLVDTVWGEMKGLEIVSTIEKVFLVVARWRRNIFDLPTGKAGEEFIEELTQLYSHFNNGTEFESVALLMTSIIFPLLLQKPSRNSKSKDHLRVLEQRLAKWKAGKLDELLNEGKAIQRSFSKKKKTRSERKYKRFISLMENGKVSSALRTIGSQETTLLDVSPEVLDELKSKHPEPKRATVEAVLSKAR